MPLRLIACAGALSLLAGSVLTSADGGPQADPRATLTVGTATASRGQTATGVIPIPPGSDPGTNIPVAIVHGAGPGPVLALVAGAHGTEYASIIALEQLIGGLDAAMISGSLIIVPLVNVASFEQKTAHVNPVDGKNMNRTYPGSADGTQSDRAALAITKEVVDQCDHLIDLHGGDLDESLRPYTYWTVTGDRRQDAISREMALAFGLDHIIISTDRPRDPNASRYLENTATLRGKPSLTAEAGHAGRTDPDDVTALVDGCLNVMRYLRILPGAPSLIEHPVWIEATASVTSEQTGIFYPLVRRGSYVQEGMRIGYVTDYVGKVIFEAGAPASGVVLYVRAVPSMTKGETIASVGIVKR
ncbi:MAG: M14 family metallopeptidase [Acidobacteriota bacterium]